MKRRPGCNFSCSCVFFHTSRLRLVAKEKSAGFLQWNCWQWSALPFAFAFVLTSRDSLDLWVLQSRMPRCGSAPLRSRQPSSRAFCTLASHLTLVSSARLGPRCKKTGFLSPTQPNLDDSGNSRNSRTQGSPSSFNTAVTLSHGVYPQNVPEHLARRSSSTSQSEKSAWLEPD